MAWTAIPDSANWEFSDDPNTDKKDIDHYDYDLFTNHIGGVVIQKNLLIRYILSRQSVHPHHGYGELMECNRTIPCMTDTIQWVSSLWDSDGTKIIDRSTDSTHDATKAQYLNIEIGNTITFAGMDAGVTLTSHGGTATVSLVNGTLSCSANGTLFDLVLSDGITYSGGQGVGTLLISDIVGGIDGILVGLTWGTSVVDGHSWNGSDGYVLADGTGTYASGAYLSASYTSEGTLYNGKSRQNIMLEGYTGIFDWNIINLPNDIIRTGNFEFGGYLASQGDWIGRVLYGGTLQDGYFSIDLDGHPDMGINNVYNTFTSITLLTNVLYTFSVVRTGSTTVVTFMDSLGVIQTESTTVFTGTLRVSDIAQSGFTGRIPQLYFKDENGVTTDNFIVQGIKDSYQQHIWNTVTGDMLLIVSATLGEGGFWTGKCPSWLARNGGCFVENMLSESDKTYYLFTGGTEYETENVNVEANTNFTLSGTVYTTDATAAIKEYITITDAPVGSTITYFSNDVEVSENLVIMGENNLKVVLQTGSTAGTANFKIGAGCNGATITGIVICTFGRIYHTDIASSFVETTGFPVYLSIVPGTTEGVSADGGSLIFTSIWYNIPSGLCTINESESSELYEADTTRVFFDIDGTLKDVEPADLIGIFGDQYVKGSNGMVATKGGQTGECALQIIKSVGYDVPQSEANALIQFYNDTDGDNWTDNTNWLTTNTVNDWFGVTVVDGHVTELDLVDNHDTISGDISAVQNLPFLSLLYLYSAPNITGNISCLSGLTNLSILSFSSSPGITGDLISLSNLPLYSINLTGTAISGDIAALSNKPSLQQIMLLDNMAISGDLAVISTLPNLQFLFLTTGISSYTQTTLPLWTDINMVIDQGLLQQEVDDFLCDLASAGGTGGVVDISGTNAGPSATGLACKATLEGQGKTVTTTIFGPDLVLNGNFALGEYIEGHEYFRPSDSSVLLTDWYLNFGRRDPKFSVTNGVVYMKDTINISYLIQDIPTIIGANYRLTIDLKDWGGAEYLKGGRLNITGVNNTALDQIGIITVDFTATTEITTISIHPYQIAYINFTDVSLKRHHIL